MRRKTTNRQAKKKTREKAATEAEQHKKKSKDITSLYTEEGKNNIVCVCVCMCCTCFLSRISAIDFCGALFRARPPLTRQLLTSDARERERERRSRSFILVKIVLFRRDSRREWSELLLQTSIF